MRAGVGYLLNTVIGSSDRLVRLRYWQDELLLLLDWLFKLYYLRNHRATYAEYFYGFERRSTTSTDFSSTKASALLAMLPYVRNKLERLYNTLKMERSPAEMKWHEKAFFYLFPIASTLWDLLDLVMRFGYLLHNAKHFDIVFYLLKVKLVYKQAEAATAGTGLLDMLNKPLILVIFLLYKGLAWYYSSRSQQRQSHAVPR